MTDDEERRRRRRPERIGDLLPAAARQLGLEEELVQARAMAAWDRLIRERVPAAADACRLTSLDRGVAVVEADEQIVAQELRLRSIELLSALRSATGGSVAEVRVVVRHV